MYLRKHMDSQGYVPLQLIATFPRLLQRTSNYWELRQACQSLKNAKVVTGPDGIDRIRANENPTQWVLEMSQRDPSAQNDGPNWNVRPQPQFWGGMPPYAPGYGPHPQNGPMPHMDPHMDPFIPDARPLTYDAQPYYPQYFPEQAPRNGVTVPTSKDDRLTNGHVQPAENTKG